MDIVRRHLMVRANTRPPMRVGRLTRYFTTSLRPAAATQPTIFSSSAAAPLTSPSRQVWGRTGNTIGQYAAARAAVSVMYRTAPSIPATAAQPHTVQGASSRSTLPAKKSFTIAGSLDANLDWINPITCAGAEVCTPAGAARGTNERAWHIR